jgi:hypothetical protein
MHTTGKSRTRLRSELPIQHLRHGVYHTRLCLSSIRDCRAISCHDQGECGEVDGPLQQPRILPGERWRNQNQSPRDDRIAFTASDTLGPFFLGPGPSEVKTERMYDAKNRRQVARRLFSLGARTCAVTFGGYGYDGSGRLRSYRVEVRSATQ